MPVGSTVYERQAPPRALVDRSLERSQLRVFWSDDAGPAPAHRPLTTTARADLTVVGGGYLGLWTAVLAKRRDPSARVVLLEAATLGHAASGRNGGFCEASITHGEENGRSRWPDEYDELERLGTENLAGLEQDIEDLALDCQFERTGTLAIAVEPHQVPWLGPDALDSAAARAQIDSPIVLAAAWDRDSTALVHPVRLVRELARVATDLGVELYQHTPVTAVETPRGTAPVLVRTTGGSVLSGRVALALNAYPSLLRRTRLLTVPVWDYVLMTEPLTAQQRASIGWEHRQGLADLANQFHYSRLTADGRILYGGYDAVYAGRRIRPDAEDRPATYRRLASHFLTTFPQLEDVRFSHRWGGVIDTCTRFAAFHGLARDGRVAYAAGFTGLGVGATRFAAEVMLDRLAGLDTPRTRLAMVRRLPVPFPPEPVAAVGITLTRWSLDRADHREGRRNPWLKALDAVGLGFDS